MNAALKSTDPTFALQAAIDKRGSARAKLEQTAQAIARAEQVATAEAAEISDLKSAVSAAQAKRAQNLAGIFLTGATKLTLAASSDEQSLESQLAHAVTRATVSDEALTLVRAAHARAQAELQAAEAAVEDAAIRIFVGEVEHVAREATEARAKAEAALERVRYAQAITDQFDRRVGGRLYSALHTHLILTAGAPPEPAGRLASDWGLPPHETSAARRTAAGIKPWADLLDSLLRGDFTKAEDSKAA
jgi:hypothetical protein